VELSQKIQEAIKDESALLGEAPTGVGKSLAALVPAFEHIMKTDEPVIVATSSIILQEQYINKDIPTLEKLYNFQATPVLIKGRNNYLCPKKLNDALSGKVGFSSPDYAEEYDSVMKWAVSTKTGDKSEMDFNPSAVVWGKVACLDNNECTGKQCPFYDTCHYYRERKKVATSKLVVCNYHYFFSALDEVNMLPPKARVLICDEGHEVSTIARDFQERKYSISILKNHFDQFAKAMQRAELSEVGETVINIFTDMELDQVNGTLTDMFVGLTHEYKRVVRGHYTRDFWQIEVPERTRLQKYATAHIEALRFSAGVAENYLRKFGFSMESIHATAEMYGDDSVEWFIIVYRLMELLEQKANLLEYIFHYEENQDDGTDLFWLQPLNDMVSLHAKPTTGAALTKRLFEKREEGYIPIVMSATLSANQSFEHIKSDLGIESDQERFPVKEIIVSSPFDLENNFLWYLPPGTPAGTDKEHLPFVLVQMEKVINLLHGRTLCLFTSRKNLLEAETYFTRVLPKSIQVISQEKWPKQKIIDHLKKHPDTVVLGTKSLFTGIDIQGQNLSAVLIDKLPFPMVADPINDYLMSEPRGFYTFSLPEAIISLKQGSGRLNRTATDKGIFACYEGRLSSASYKNRIFNSFDFKIKATKNWEDVAAYIQSLQLEG
jgi:ATP-dependent DNA helicase DinG